MLERLAGDAAQNKLPISSYNYTYKNPQLFFGKTDYNFYYSYKHPELPFRIIETNLVPYRFRTLFVTVV